MHLKLSNDHGLSDDNDSVILLVMKQILDCSFRLQDFHATAILVQVVDDSRYWSGVAIKVFGIAQTSANQTWNENKFKL